VALFDLITRKWEGLPIWLNLLSVAQSAVKHEVVDLSQMNLSSRSLCRMW